MLIHAIISWHVQKMIINGFGVVIMPMWVGLDQICGWGWTKIVLPNFWAKILPDDIQHPQSHNQFYAYPCHHLLTCPDDDNQWFLLSRCELGWVRCVVRVGQKLSVICPTYP
jgi:hypothetical protein